MHVLGGEILMDKKPVHIESSKAGLIWPMHSAMSDPMKIVKPQREGQSPRRPFLASPSRLRKIRARRLIHVKGRNLYHG
jgi:hypothetical protein